MSVRVAGMLVTGLGLVVVACGGAGSSTPAASPAGPVVASPAAAMAAAPRERRESLTAGSIPRFFPNYVKPCGATELEQVMKERMSPSLSAVSAALYHDDGEVGARFDEVSDAVAVMLGCSETIANHRDRFAADDWPAFDHFLRSLVTDAHALQTAAIERDEAAVDHWFLHVKQSCAACHARFAPPAE